MKSTHKLLLVGSILAVLLIAVFSAGCTSVFEDGLNFFNGDSGSSSAANNPTDTTTKMSMSLVGNQLTNNPDKYVTTSIGTVSGSPAQLTVSLSNGFNIVANPSKIVFNGGGWTITSDISTGTTVANSGSKSLTVTPHDGATADENGKSTTYKESGGATWNNLRLTLKDYGQMNYIITENSFPDISSGFGESTANSFSITNGNSWKISQKNIRKISYVNVDVAKNTATVKVEYYDSGYRKHTQTMSLTWNNGKWHLYKAVEDPSTIDEEELNG